MSIIERLKTENVPKWQLQIILSKILEHNKETIITSDGSPYPTLPEAIEAEIDKYTLKSEVILTHYKNEELNP